MDWNKIKTETPEAYKVFSGWLNNRYNTSTATLKFHYLVFILQEFFAEYSIYVWIERKEKGWCIKINGESKGNYQYEVSLNAWEVAFSMGFVMLDARYKQEGLARIFLTRDVYNAVIDFLPERHKKKFNNFNATVNALRKNKLKNFIFVEGVDWFKKENTIYYTQLSLKKIKQYFITLKMKS